MRCSMRIAIVTGASSGLGREYVKELPRVYKKLDEIWVIARRKERLLQLQKTNEIPIRIFQGDLRENKIYETLKRELIDKKPNIRMLINCAGIGKYGLFEEIKEEENLEMIALNCYGSTKIIYTCRPYFREESRIIQVASAAAITAQPYFSVYAATKAYIESISLALAREMKKAKVYVTCVCPGPIQTEFLEISGSKKKYHSKRFLATPTEIVTRSLVATLKKKPLCICGPYMKGVWLMGKLLPETLSVKFMYLFNKRNS